MRAVKLFAQIKINTSNAAEKVAKLIELRDKAMEMAKGDELAESLNPQFKAEGNTILIGMEFKG